MRRSLTIGGSLTPADTERLLETCGELLAERVRIQRVLAQLGPAWGGTLIWSAPAGCTAGFGATCIVTAG